MVAPAARSLDKFLTSPPHGITGILLYGADAPQIAAGADRLAISLSQRHKPSSRIIRLHETDIAADPNRVAVELQTDSLFGERKLLYIIGLPQKAHAAIIDAVAQPTPHADIVVQAPDLKRTHKITQVFEGAAHLAAIACFGEDETNLPRSIRQYGSNLGCDVESDAAMLVASRTNFSILLAHREIEKLAAFAGDTKTITLNDVETCLTDQRTAGAHEAVDAALAGDGRRALIAFERLMASENNVVPVLITLASSLQRLHALRTAVEQGITIKDAVGRFRPPVFFKQQQAVAEQVERWPLPALERALPQVNEIIKETRLKAQLAEALTANLLISTARLARK